MLLEKKRYLSILLMTKKILLILIKKILVKKDLMKKIFMKKMLMKKIKYRTSKNTHITYITHMIVNFEANKQTDKIFFEFFKLIFYIKNHK